MCSSLNELLKLDLFFMFLLSYSNLQEYSLSLHTFWSKRSQNLTLAYVQMPYTELPFNVWKREQLVTKGQHTVDDICMVKFMVRFGRPLWWALWEAGDRVVQDGIIQLAMDKLAACTVGKYEVNSFLAALSIRVMLDFHPQRMRATEVQNLMVAGHLQVANVIPVHCEYMISSTLSEPIIAEVAAQVLHGQNMIDLLSQNVREGLIEKGQQGELVTHLLLTLAQDQALEDMEIAYKDNQGQLEQLYTSPISVVTFFCALFPQQYVDKLLCRHADNSPGGLTFKEAFADTYVMFTHFGKAADDWCMSNTFMFMALCCNMAISC
ncbi:hypothetical protein PILCRDRAFT_89580 [Piloderma croceum F 1598]|uniref:Uncharacterized protein n=1 Tax=Piloderma croceum (strain F 1598) TaxID=765440 RepID=A0A0C3F7N5_PILCF|nr:hypothetical protein PILCRDRAFT_89580 [Piloderma croceum F 1598]